MSAWWVAALVACGHVGGPASPVDASMDEAASKVMIDVLGSDERTRALHPLPGDYDAVFVEGTADLARGVYEPLWRNPDVAITAGPDQTRLLVTRATTEQLQAWDADARAFPGGYREIAPHLKPGLTFYRWKYVEPGETSGMAYDGLVLVNGHWAWFPKPWRVLPPEDD